ncbi:MAG: glycine oxidase ThiO [Candidatus Eremiobacteraeota bacterium]|nr:glycine oxidase ThiO [Candidatus Eremiobacteraeota bacterium]
MSADVAIIGGGLIGLSIALELRTQGATVRVFDRGDPGRAASWAGAGMLAPFTEAIHDPMMQALCQASLAAYPAFVESVREQSGVDPHLRLDGVLTVATSEDALRDLHAEQRLLNAQGVQTTLLDRAQTLALEPALDGSITGSLHVFGEGQVDNRRLGRALVGACTTTGVTISANVKSLRVECDRRRALGIATEQGFCAAGAVINAAGAWSAQIDGVPEAVAARVYPVKGQMITIEIPSGFMRHVTWVPGAYFVPREDGRLLVGATTERDAGFDTRVTAAGVESLLRSALRAAPALGSFSISEMWAGLRPGTSDGKPLVGRTDLEKYFVASGHYRNGILLAPITATILADALSGRSNDFLAFLSPMRSLPEAASA